MLLAFLTPPFTFPNLLRTDPCLSALAGCGFDFGCGARDDSPFPLKYYFGIKFFGT